tara:strand:+ start:160 stop:582 length:423 start_codon:yes stop_codon:yes gene_type:complete
MIKKALESIKNIFVPPIEYRNFEDDIECAIDEDVVECKEMDKEPSYTGIPAPAIPPTDQWFNPPILSEKGIDYMEKEVEMKRQEREENFSVEPENIHQVMYEIATKNQSTTLHLDPPGGSENFQSGPGGWNSGTGQNQFR